VDWARVHERWSGPGAGIVCERRVLCRPVRLTASPNRAAVAGGLYGKLAGPLLDLVTAVLAEGEAP
jgi:hypothetical protein